MLSGCVFCYFIFYSIKVYKKKSAGNWFGILETIKIRISYPQSVLRESSISLVFLCGDIQSVCFNGLQIIKQKTEVDFILYDLGKYDI